MLNSVSEASRTSVSSSPVSISDSNSPQATETEAPNIFGGHTFAVLRNIRSWVSDMIDSATSRLKQIVGGTTTSEYASSINPERTTTGVLPKQAIQAKSKSEKKAVEIKRLNTSGEKSITASVIPEKDRPREALHERPSDLEADFTEILTQSYTTNITGASAIPFLKQSYEDDGIAIVASKDDANTTHSINASLDTLTAQDGALLYSGVRSGVYTTPKIKDQKTRLEAANKRFDENLLIALESKEWVFSAYKTSSANNPIELTIADIGLLSGKMGSLNPCKPKDMGNEGIMQDEQFAFLKEANNQAREITYKNTDGVQKTIWVKPKIIAFNFGVQAFDATLSKVTGVRNYAENAAALEALKSEINSKINSLNQHIEKLNESDFTANIKNLEIEKQTIELLRDQLDEMAKTDTIYDPQHGDNYAFTARLNLLCFKLGITPMIHCKSGKDRTARLLEETKFLAIQIHELVISTKDKSLDETRALLKNKFPQTGELRLNQQELLFEVSMNSGNDIVQKNCTGHPGNKQANTLTPRIKKYLDSNSAAKDLAKKYKAPKGTEV